MESILTSIKKSVNLEEDCVDYDTDIIMHINTVFSNLTMLGVGPSSGFRITDNKSKWSDFLGEDIRLENVKTYTSLRVRLIFDPPSSSAVIEAMKREIDKLEWLINVTAETKQS